MPDDMSRKIENGGERPEPENLNAAERRLLFSLQEKALHAKTPLDLELNATEKGSGSGWDSYGSDELVRKAKIWGARGTKNKNLYYDSDENKAVFAGGEVLLDVQESVVLDSGKSGDVLKIAFPMNAEGIRDDRYGVTEKGEKYFPALLDLMVPAGTGEQLKKEIEDGAVRVDRIIENLYPGLKGRLLIEQSEQTGLSKEVVEVGQNVDVAESDEERFNRIQREAEEWKRLHPDPVKASLSLLRPKTREEYIKIHGREPSKEWYEKQGIEPPEEPPVAEKVPEPEDGGEGEDFRKKMEKKLIGEYNCSKCGARVFQSATCGSCEHEDVGFKGMVSEYIVADRLTNNEKIDEVRRYGPLRLWLKRYGGMGKLDEYDEESRERIRRVRGNVNWEDVYIRLAEVDGVPDGDPDRGTTSEPRDEEIEYLRRMAESQEKMQKQQEKFDVKSGLEREGLVDLEAWQDEYYKKLHSAIDDIELGSGQVTLEQFKGRFNLIFEGTSLPQDFFQLMSSRYGKEAKSLEDLTVSLHKVLTNGIASFENRKNGGGLVEMRKGGGGLKWLNMTADDFDRIAGMRGGEELSKALGLYVSLGKTSIDNPLMSKKVAEELGVDYEEVNKERRGKWKMTIGGQEFVNPFVKKPKEVGDANGNTRELRQAVVAESADWAEKLALSMMYATDLPGLFGADFSMATNWASVSRKYYYPFDELKRLGVIGEEPLPGRLKEDLFLVRLQNWGGEDLTFCDPFVSNPNGVVLESGVKMNMLEAWSKGLFDQIKYFESGFGGSGKHTGGILSADKAYEAVKTGGEGKRLDRAGLGEFQAAVVPALSGYGDGEKVFIQKMLEESWFWSFMATVEAEMIEAGPGRSGKVDRSQFANFMRKAHADGFLLKKGEAKRYVPDLYAKIEETKEKLAAASVTDKPKLQEELKSLEFFEGIVSKMDSYEIMMKRFGPGGLEGFFNNLLGN